MRRNFSKDPIMDEREAINAIMQWVYPLKNESDLQPLIDRIGDASIVLLGEARLN